MSIEKDLDKELEGLYTKKSVNWGEVMRLSAEIDRQREQAETVAKRLLGNGRSMGVDIGDGQGDRMAYFYHNSRTGATTPVTF